MSHILVPHMSAAIGCGWLANGPLYKAAGFIYCSGLSLELWVHADTTL